MSIYTEERLLRNKDVEMHRRLRTSRLFELMQEASIRHTEQLGMGRKKTLDKGLLWMIGLQKAEIRRIPEYDERIVLKTWPGETMRFFFPRYYSFETAEGEPLLKASALWTLVDAEKRQMANPERYGVIIHGVRTGEEIGLPAAPRRLACDASREFTVPYSYVDLNGHMNNTRYFDLAEDTIPAAAQGRRLKSLAVEYSSEVRLGDTLRLDWGRDGESYYLAGQTEKPCFRMRFEYYE